MCKFTHQQVTRQIIKGMKLVLPSKLLANLHYGLNSLVNVVCLSRRIHSGCASQQEAKGAAAPSPSHRSWGCKATRRRFIKLCSMPTVCQLCCHPPHLSFPLGNSSRSPARKSEREKWRNVTRPPQVRLNVRVNALAPNYFPQRLCFQSAQLSHLAHASNLPL